MINQKSNDFPRRENRCFLLDNIIYKIYNIVCTNMKGNFVMSEFKVIEIKRSVFENNDREADKVREQLKKDRTFLLNLMSSPGSGKTTTLKATIKALKDEYKMGVMEADIDSDVDARAIEEAGSTQAEWATSMQE